MSIEPYRDATLLPIQATHRCLLSWKPVVVSVFQIHTTNGIGPQMAIVVVVLGPNAVVVMCTDLLGLQSSIPNQKYEARKPKP